MAAGDPYILCKNPEISWVTLLNSILVKDTVAGTVGIRVNMHTAGAAGNVVSLQACGGRLPVNLEQFLRESIVLDSDDKPALNLIQVP